MLLLRFPIPSWAGFQDQTLCSALGRLILQLPTAHTVGKPRQNLAHDGMGNLVPKPTVRRCAGNLYAYILDPLWLSHCLSRSSFPRSLPQRAHADDSVSFPASIHIQPG